MWEMRTADGQGEGLAGEGNKSKANEARRRRRLIEKVGQKVEGASVKKAKAITSHAVFHSTRGRGREIGEHCELSAERTSVSSDLICNRVVPW